MEHLQLKIEGMSCGHCVAAVKRALTAPGIQAGKVAVGMAELDYDPGQISLAAILGRIDEEGYKAVDSGQ